MKARIPLLPVVALLALTLAACGTSSSMPGGTGGMGGMGNGSGTMTPGGSTTPNPQATQVMVTLSDFKVEASQTTFKVGVPYRFVVTNAKSSTANHEFMVIPPMSGDNMDMEQLDKMALTYITADKLPPGATQSVDYTFQKPYAQGELEFACYVGSHYSLGMHTPVSVTQS